MIDTDDLAAKRKRAVELEAQIVDAESELSLLLAEIEELERDEDGGTE